jgi:peptidoglycan hydrolase-like protein with peptidoglycan-binding domain
MQLIRRGSTGEIVKAVQNLVNFSTPLERKLVVDGIFGPKTQAGVVKFQQQNRLSPDGIVGPITATTLHDVFARNFK